MAVSGRDAGISQVAPGDAPPAEPPAPPEAGSEERAGEGAPVRERDSSAEPAAADVTVSPAPEPAPDHQACLALKGFRARAGACAIPLGMLWHLSAESGPHWSLRPSTEHAWRHRGGLYVTFSRLLPPLGGWHT